MKPAEHVGARPVQSSSETPYTLPQEPIQGSFPFRSCPWRCLRGLRISQVDDGRTDGALTRCRDCGRVFPLEDWPRLLRERVGK